MSQFSSCYGSLAVISPLTSPPATPAERIARDLLSRHTPADTAEALRCLLEAQDEPRGAEWYFLMGVCALRRGFLTDAQAHLDHACTLGQAEAVTEYRALYESVRKTFEKRRSDEENRDRDYACFSAADCCDCLYCCDCDGDGSCCDGPDGCCDCCDC